jgi:NAD(P)-dependent dehydrogenase (short-subunit alcohol dehydrogenase family)
MDGATTLDDNKSPADVPQARTPEQSKHFSSFHNYVALPPLEAFRIEYWALEDAKLQRMPPEREFSRKIALVVGGASGIGKEVVFQLARRGAHVVVADLNEAVAREVAAHASTLSSPEMLLGVGLDLSSRKSIRDALTVTTFRFGGVDIVINTAALFPTPAGIAQEEVWNQTMAVNVSSNHVLAVEANEILQAQGLPATIVLTSSANAVVPKHGSEPYDVSKAAINHLIRELAIGFGPNVRVNGVAPATVVTGSAMFSRPRVIASLEKYKISFSEQESTEELRQKLAAFYAQRTITGLPILPADCANAICWLAGEQSSKTTGHVIPVDGGLPEAFLR